MAIDLNTRYYREWTDKGTLDTMRLSFVPGHNVMYSGTMPSVELPPAFVLEAYEVDDSFKDNLPFGRQENSEMTINIDISDLYDRTTAWADLIPTLITGQSETLVSAAGGMGYVFDVDFYPPNLWILENRTTSKVKFVGTQEPKKVNTWTYRNSEPLEIKAVGIEAYIMGFLGMGIVLLQDSEEPETAFIRRNYIYQHEYTDALRYMEYRWQDGDNTERDGAGDDLSLYPRFKTVAEIMSFFFDTLAADVYKAIVRDSTATIGHSGTFLECHNIYAQDGTKANNRTGLALTTSELYMIPSITKSKPRTSILNWGFGMSEIVDDDAGGLLHDTADGWASMPNLWDLFGSLAENGLCQLRVDHNGTSDIDFNFTQPFKTSSASILLPQSDINFDQFYSYIENYSVTRSGTYDGEINEINQNGLQTDNGESYELPAVFEFTGHPMAFGWSTNTNDIGRAQTYQSQNVPNIRAFYVKFNNIRGYVMKIVHDYFDLDLGDGVTYSNSSANVYRFALPNAKDHGRILSKFRSYLAGRTLLSYGTYNYILQKLFKNKAQGLILATVSNNILDNTDVGKSYTIDTDIIVDGLGTTIGQKVVLTGCKTNYNTGFSECSFFVRGENA